MKALNIYAVLSDVDEDIIESTLPPSLLGAPVSPQAKGESRISRFLSNGWVAAALSTVVALAVIVAIVLAGRGNPDLPPAGSVGESETITETAATENPDNYIFVGFHWGDEKDDHLVLSWYHSYTELADDGERVTTDLGRYPYEESDLDDHTPWQMNAGDELVITNIELRDWSYSATAEVYDTERTLLLECALSDLAHLEAGSYIIIVHYKGEGREPDSEGRVAFWLESQFRLDIIDEDEPTPAAFTVSVNNLLAKDAARITVNYRGKNPGEDIPSFGTLKLERVYSDTNRREISVAIPGLDRPDGFQAPSADAVAQGELVIIADLATNENSLGLYRLTVTCEDGTTASCEFYIVQAPTYLTPVEGQAFRYGYSVSAPDGWGRGKIITLTLFKQNISDENLISDHPGASSNKTPYFRLFMDMGEDNLPYVLPHDFLSTEDVTDYGHARGETVVRSYSFYLPEDMPTGGRYFDLSVDGVVFEDVFSEYGMKDSTIYNERGAQTPIQAMWQMARQQVSGDTASIPADMPLSAEDVRARVETLRNVTAGLMQSDLVRTGQEVGLVVVYDEGCREVARGTDLGVLNECLPCVTYYVDLITWESLSWDGEDENGNFVGGTEHIFTEYLFPFLRYERTDSSAGVDYTLDKASKTYTVTGLDEEALHAEHITVTDVIWYLPVATLSDGAFTGCAATTVILPRSVVSVGGAFRGCAALTEIHYRGTVANWNAVEKPADWASGSPKLTRVVCTDGEISVNPAP